MSPLESAKAALSIPELARRRGWQWEPGKLCPVPYRPDRHPSGSVFADGKLFRDFASAETFDAPALLARIENLTNESACKLFIELAGLARQDPSTSAPVKQDAYVPRIKPRLPKLAWPTSSELAQIAALRNVSLDAVRLAERRGFLFITKFNGLPCWALTDRSGWICQLRRLDGELFARHDGVGYKAWTVTGSYGAWPVGTLESSRFDSIALTEGSGDFLAAFHFALVEGRARDVTAVAMLGGGSRIAPEALHFFQEKIVRIFAHADQPGIEAAARWQQQLTEAGAADVHCFDLSDLLTSDGRPVKDLNDLTSLDADEFESDRQLSALMDL
jgi:hypothetical protein